MATLQDILNQTMVGGAPVVGQWGPRPGGFNSGTDYNIYGPSLPAGPVAPVGMAQARSGVSQQTPWWQRAISQGLQPQTMNPMDAWRMQASPGQGLSQMSQNNTSGFGPNNPTSLQGIYSQYGKIRNGGAV